nr:PAS domain S-box protein [Bacteroidota bacterium]
MPPVPVDLPAEKIIKHLNKHAVVAEVNDALSKMYGLSSEEMIGKPATDFAPDYGKRAELVLREKNYHISGVETLDIDKYGKPLYLEESYHGEVHEGYLYRIWGVQRNITERKQAEEVIRISENKFRSLAETSVDCIWQSDLRLRFTYLSPALYPMTGFHPEEWIGTPLSKHVRITEFIKMARLALKVIKSYKTFDFVVIENHFLRKNGEEFPVEIIGKPLIESGKLIGLQGTARDITERKQAEKSLKERELRYYTLLQNLGGMVYRCKNDKDWTMLFVSEGCLGLTGYKPEDLLNNKMLSFNNLVDADVRDFLWDTWQAKLNRREPVEMEYRIKKATGEWIWVWERGRGIFDDDGQLMHLEGYIFDVTDRRKAEDELVSARDRAEESDRLKSAFLANMSHEIRTPMNGILGFADLLKEPDLTGEEQQKYIRVIENSGQRMLNTINDLIDISKIESGQMEVVMADTGINEQMETLFSFFKPEANKKELQLSYKNGLPDTNAIIHTDSEKLFAVLTNLVKNAIKYTNKGSIEFAYTLKQTNNTLPGNPDKAGEPVEPVELEFYVKDTGIGIPPEKFDMIFERFAQADNYLTKSYEGSGLGLSISKAYVEMLGGRIWVESGQGKGTAFYFSLPYNPIASQKDVQTIVTDKVVDFSLPKRIKVLVVEDDADSREFLSEILARISADVIFVSNGLDAIDQCKSNPNLDIILMDIKMPGMDGYEATQRIRKFNKEVVIIAQTAFAFAGDRVKALHAGCNDYISKPIGKEKLLKLIHHLIT